MSSPQQSKEVFRRCMDVAKELDSGGRAEDGTAVLRALQVYLDTLPAFPDGSCKNTTRGLLEKMGARARESQPKLPRE